jgi:hypothetical protein
MTTATLLSVLLAALSAMPSLLPLVQKLVADIAAGKANDKVTDADYAELDRLAALDSASIYRRENVTPPPPAA